MWNYYIVPHTSPPPIFLTHTKYCRENEKEWNVPEEYLEIPLDKEKKEALIQTMNFQRNGQA